MQGLFSQRGRVGGKDPVLDGRVLSTVRGQVQEEVVVGSCCGCLRTLLALKLEDPGLLQDQPGLATALRGVPSLSSLGPDSASLALLPATITAEAQWRCGHHV